MRTFLIILVAVVILGGGWYWYSQQSATSNNMNMNAELTPTNSNNEVPVTNVTPSMETATSTPATMGTTKEFTVEGKNFSFTPAAMTVKKGDTVKITFKNVGGFHDFRVDGYNVGTKQIGDGASETFSFVADKAGSFEYFCSVGKHRAMGMKGTLTVTP